MDKNDIADILLRLRKAEDELKAQDLTQEMKDYMEANDELVSQLQAYIDYLLLDDQSGVERRYMISSILFLFTGIFIGITIWLYNI